jgi:hypothetical protein
MRRQAMTKPNDKKKRPAKSKKNPNEEPIPILRVRKGATLKEIYTAAHRAFTAADLQKFTEIEEEIPARQLLAELEAISKEEKQRRQRKSKNDRPK